MFLPAPVMREDGSLSLGMASFNASKLVVKDTADRETEINIHSFNRNKKLFEGWNDHELTSTKDAKSSEFIIKGTQDAGFQA